MTQKAVELALAGNMQALKVCLDCVWPPRNSCPIQIEFPKVETAADLTAAQGAVIAAMARASHIPIPSLHPDYPSPTFSVRIPL